MGLKGEGREVFSKDSVVQTTLPALRQKCIKARGADSDYRPLAAVDTAIWENQTLRNPHKNSKVSAQYHANPKVPVIAVSTAIVKKASLLRRNGFDVVLVFDGVKHPLKDDEHKSRAGRAKIEEKKANLLDAYKNPSKYSEEQVSLLKRDTVSPREDITHEVVSCARKNSIYVVGSALETDHQIGALQNQGIIDVAVSTDTDILGLGVKHVIKSMNKDGRCKVMSYEKLTQKVLPKEFGLPGVQISQFDVALYCNMLGNDFLPSGKANDGRKRTATKMKDYLSRSEEGRREFIQSYRDDHETPERFDKSLFFWQHAPAYIVVPKSPEVSPKDAFISGEYDIVLGSMMVSPNHRGDSFYREEDGTPKLGFMPEEEMRKNHNLGDDVEPPSHRDFFQLEKYVRTGKPLEPVEKQYNKNNQEVAHGANIRFEEVPVKFIQTRQLEFWLSCRGVCTVDMERPQMVTMVEKLRRNEVDALPYFVLRGGGAYVAVCTLEFMDEESVDWKTKDDALEEIRGEKCACLDSPEFMSEVFASAHNAKRLRCLKHLKSGSFDIVNLKVSSSLKSKLIPDSTFFVVEFSCAPSQKGLGAEGKVYSLRLAFRDTGSGWILMPTPYSLCACPVGVWICAHRGGEVLLLWAIRQCFKGLSFEELRFRLPANIHAFANQLHMVHYLYPAPYSSESRIEKKIKKEAKEAPTNDSTRQSDEDDRADVDARGDIELEDENDREMAAETDLSRLIDLCKEVTTWSKEIELSYEIRGVGHRYDPKESQAAAIEAAMPDTDPGSMARRQMRYINQVRSVRAGRAPRTLYGRFAEEYAGNICDEMSFECRLRDHMNDPYEQIYGDDAGTESDCDAEDIDGEYAYYEVDSDDEDYSGSERSTEDDDEDDSDGSNA
mmetsp:Transcript_37891/g.80932  ORF Transcript_37891/g.80932 Transcript_37891/m.80932 type:complete len:891 (-) Transcript_37891:11-2683(-)|eukprot:CAMPEP_0172538976 /NCGR_PEP_ID=MMETSP1067-20121228/10262_1 /TAXON_ID=265564 ORGANISM="Thalassiosira punctigera, Strain Tpunct2005C2" /NCGR_SAMPLE_ID=MMETSP1067 /ASSEMBLY_ACC=CAM_ASM_000444 /LENGTH=890 /DNA_ID=CAMNT_0013324581 /DNA_START=91 /DNA_END=2763 /DNA_ORIENTATION=+